MTGTTVPGMARRTAAATAHGSQTATRDARRVEPARESRASALPAGAGTASLGGAAGRAALLGLATGDSNFTAGNAPFAAFAINPCIFATSSRAAVHAGHVARCASTVAASAASSKP